MEIKETTLRTMEDTGILSDIEYYKYIFKKTEKIACAVFYITRTNKSNRQDDAVIRDVELAATRLLDVSLESLRSTIQDIEERAIAVRYALIALESKLRIAHAARLIETEFLEVFLHELDSVQRSLKKYVEPKVMNPLYSTEQEVRAPRENKPTRARDDRQNREGGVAPQIATRSRRDRVLDVLRDKGEATIKDIVEVVTDCSEKTIQRELINLIKDNIVNREGERRWSKYKIV